MLKAHNVLISLLCLGALAACTPAEEPTATDTPAAEDTTVVASETAIVLPDGTACLNAGQGATLAFEGKRLNYTCGDTQGLIGDIDIIDGTEITLELATLDGTTITASEALTLTVNAVELADGTTCLNAGEGATLAFDGQRLNFTCPDAASEAGLLGDITAEEGIFTVAVATLEGTDLVSTETQAIAALETATP